MQFRNLFAAALMLGFAIAPSSWAQVLPTQTPVYIPTAIKTLTNLTAAGNVGYLVSGTGTVVANITGTNTGVAGTFQVTSDAPSVASPTWKSVGVSPVGGTGAGRILNITGNGVYKINAVGYAQIRFNLTAISTGSINVAYSGTPATGLVEVATVKRSTYAASGTALAPAASLTDLIALTGSATTTLRLLRVACSNISTAAATSTLQLIKRSVADTAGTPVSMTTVPFDSTDPAAAGTITAYSANPTVGTAVGTIRSDVLTSSTAATSVAGKQVVWDFRDLSESEQPTLRGIAQVLAINGNGASMTAGSAVNCDVTWSEE